MKWKDDLLHTKTNFSSEDIDSKNSKDDTITDQITNSPVDDIVWFFRAYMTRIINSGDKIIVSKYRNVIPTTVFLISAWITTQVWKMEQYIERDNLRTTLESQLTEIIHPIQNRIVSYELLLAWIRGSFDVSWGITKKWFQAYVDNVQICEKLPETSGVSISFRVSKDNLEKYKEKMIQENVIDEQHWGYPIISFSNMSWTSQHAPVTYMIPPNPSVIGKDNFENVHRKEAMIKSQISGNATLSDPIQLWQKGTTENHDGYLMFLPFYKHGFLTKTPEERYNAIEWWTAVAFSISELIAEIFHSNFSWTQLVIEDASTQNWNTVIFRSPREWALGDGVSLTTKKQVSIGNRDWIFTLSTPRESQMSKQYSNNVKSIVISGSIISILLTFFIYFSGSTTCRFFSRAS
jgi:CHASE1-domain containing sensor protein